MIQKRFRPGDLHARMISGLDPSIDAESVETGIRNVTMADLTVGRVPVRLADTDGVPYLGDTRIEVDGALGMIYIPGVVGDLKPALAAGLSSVGYNRIGVFGESYSAEGIRGLAVTGTGVLGEASGAAGVGGAFLSTAASASGSALTAVMDGASNTGQAIYARNAGGGRVALLEQIGTGIGMEVSLTAAGNASVALRVVTVGTGRAGQFEISNAASTTHALYALTNGTSASIAIKAEATGGGGALFATATTGTTLSALATTGRAALFTRNTASPTIALVEIVDDHATGSQTALVVRTDSAGTALNVSSAGTGDAIVATAVDGRVAHLSRNFGAPTGPVVRIFNDHGSDSTHTLEVETDGSGAAFWTRQNAGGFALQATTQSTTNNAAIDVARVISARSSAGGTAAGFGLRLEFGAETTTTKDVDVAAIQVTWPTATHASRKGRLELLVNDSGAERLGLRIEGSGTAVMMGFWGAAAVARPAALTAANAGAIGATWTATEQAIMINMRTRINELENRLQGPGLLT